MKKVIPFTIISIAMILYVWLIFASLMNNCVLIGIVLLSLLIFGFVDIVGLLKYRNYIRKKIQDPKTNLKRNYSTIIIGKQNGIINTDPETLDLRNYDRNFYVDTLIVERYYSFLKKGGVVKFFAGNDRYYRESKKIPSFDYPLLHTVTLMEHGIKSKSIKALIKQAMLGYGFLFNQLCSQSINSKIAEKDYLQSLGVIMQFITFCEERNISYEFYICG